MRTYFSDTILVWIAIFALSGRVNGEPRFNPIIAVEGVVTERVYAHSGKCEFTNQFPFTVLLDAAGRWQITWQMYFPDWRLTSKETISFDGTNVFSVVYADKRLDAKMQPISNLPLNKNEHPARVCRGPFPTDHSSGVGLLWLAFMGGGHIGRSPEQPPPNLLVAGARSDPEAWVTDFRYTLNSGSPLDFLESASFLLNKSKLSTKLDLYPELDEPDSPDRLQSALQAIKRLKAAKEEDGLRASYTLMELKQVGGLQVPVRFSGSRYSPVGSAAGHFARVEWSGEVTNVATSLQAVPLLPPIIGKLHVEDRRLMHRTDSMYVNQVFYPLGANGWILSTNDPVFQDQSVVRLNMRQSLGARKFDRAASLVLLALLIAWPLYLMAKKHPSPSSTVRRPIF